mgnify:FL=1
MAEQDSHPDKPQPADSAAHPTRPDPPPAAGPRGDNRHVADVLNRFMSQFTIEGAEDHIGFYSSWQEIAGINLSAHSRPVDIRNGSIVVELDHPGWMQRLQMETGRIVREVNRRFPQLGIRNMYLRVVEAGDRGVQHEAVPRDNPVSRDERGSARLDEPYEAAQRDSASKTEDVDPEVKKRFAALRHALNERRKQDGSRE